jgi:hypothetical protein
MRLPTVLTAASLVLVTMSAAACSSGSTTSAAAPSTSATSAVAAPSAAGGASASTAISVATDGASASVNVCQLLTAAQATSIIGAAYTASTPSFGGKSCTYASTVAPTPMVITVTTNAGSAAAWTNELSTLQLDDGETPVTISGLGDRAATAIDSLATQSGTWIIQVDGGDQTSVGGVFTKSIAVAKAIIAGLH